MPPITDEHTDELEARRLRREARQASPAANGSAPAGAQAAGAARDLLRGLITDGARGDEAGSAATDSGSESKPAAPANSEHEDRAAPESAPRTPRESEAIDELIRRVKDSAAGAAAETSSTLEQRRPKGTADLARDAATTRAATRRRAPETELRSSDVAPTPKKHRRARGRGGAARGYRRPLGHAGRHRRNERASTPRLVDSQIATRRPRDPATSAGRSRPRSPRSRPSSERSPGASASSARAAAARHAAKRRQIRSRAKHARAKHQAAVVQRAPVTNSPPPSTTGTQTQSSTAAQAPASTASQTSATSQPSATSSSRPAGPIGAGPLGGIGSCVKGC